jgi:hypothetical protein
MKKSMLIIKEKLDVDYLKPEVEPTPSGQIYQKASPDANNQKGKP